MDLSEKKRPFQLIPGRILLGFSMAMLLLIGAGVISYQALVLLSSSNELINQSYRLISLLETVGNRLVNSQTEIRTYYITHDSTYLRQSQILDESAADAIQSLKSLSFGKAELASRLSQVEKLESERDALVRSKIEVLHKYGLAAADRKYPATVSQALLREIERLTADCRAIEERTLESRKERAESASRFAKISLTLGGILGALILGGVFLLLIGEMRRRRFAEVKVGANEKRLTQILERIPVGIFILDRFGKSYYANSAATEMLGKEILPNGSQEEIQNNYSLYVLGSDTLYPNDRLPIVRALAGEPNSADDVEIHRPDRRIPLHVSASPVYNSEGVVEYAIAAFIDLTAQRDIEKALLDARKLAESATNAKSEFLATMSHEIRTPMNGIIGTADLMDQTPLSREQREYLSTIRSSSDTLLTIINDILDFSKIESGKLELEHRSLELSEVIEHTFDLVWGKAQERNLDLLYLIEPSTPSQVIGDPTRIQQILLNLVGNAIKFTDKGEVYVHVSLLQRLDHKARLEVQVRDTGIGIPPDRLDRLFKTFSQVDASTTRKYGGTGLGLAISKRLVELMGGSIRVESREGTGTSFYFSITVGVAEIDELAPTRYQKDRVVELKGKRILLVDDNRTNLNILSIQCTSWGLISRATASAREALDWIQKRDPFDVVILDHQMPETDGVELARQIKARRERADLPIILFSSLGPQKLEPDDQKLFSAIISKPMKQSGLFDTLVDALATQRSPQDIPPPPSDTFGHNASPAFPLKILVAEDNPVNQKLVQRMLLQLGYRCDVANNGNEVLALLKNKTVDLILMDLQMPELDGIEATKQIFATFPAEQRPKIIALTADAMAGDRERCINAGMDDYLSKPLRLETLRSVIEQYGAIVADNAERAASATRSHIGARIDELRREVGAEFVVELIQLARTHLPEELVALRAALNTNDASTLATAAHKLRGEAIAIGAAQLANAVKQIEVKAGEGHPGDIKVLPNIERLAQEALAALDDEEQRLRKP